MNNSNRIKRQINLDKQACREDPDYISMVSADEEEDLVPDLLSFEMHTHALHSLSPSELFPTIHTVKCINFST